MSCQICCEDYNKTTRKEVVCCFTDCKYSACKGCIRTYLLGTTNDPNCMNCKKVWDQNFLIKNLNRAFYDNDYKKHRKQLLVDREISKLPETMNAAEKYKLIKEEEKKIKSVNEKMSELKKELIKLNNEKSNYIKTIVQIKNNTTERKKFIMACPNNDCRGFLSTQYKCDLCNLYTCHDCHDIIGYTKHDAHVCKQECIDSALMIKKETKSCPTCAVRIFKISGCDQMWCPECKVAFSWKTGKIDNGVVHNPHFYQHMKNNKIGIAPRNPGDILCGGLIGMFELRRLTSNLTLNSMGVGLFKIHRVVAHITHVSLVTMRENVRKYEDHQDIRINYILNIKTKQEMATQIYKHDNLRKKYSELLHIYELISIVGIEMFNEINGSKNKNVNEFVSIANNSINNYKALILYCNNELKKISATYNNKVIQISDTWELSNKLFKLSDYKENIEIKYGNNNHEAGSSKDPV